MLIVFHKGVDGQYVALSESRFRERIKAPEVPFAMPFDSLPIGRVLGFEMEQIFKVSRHHGGRGDVEKVLRHLLELGFVADLVALLNVSCEDVLHKS